MLRAYTAAAVRAAEEPLLAAGEPLMARAARAVELAVVEELRGATGGVAGGRVVVLVGAGNNGGDGLFAAAGLARRGVGVTVLLASARPHAEGVAAVRATGARVSDVSATQAAQLRSAVGRALAGCDVLVDALAGTGVSGALRGPIGQVAEAAVEALAGAAVPPVVVAVDVPSGIGVDDGATPGVTLPADRTVTMGGVKAGLLLPPAAGLAGELELVDLGLDLASAPVVAARLGTADVADVWPAPTRTDHKYSRGVLGVLAGSDGYPGAAVLAVSGAAPLVGMVRYAGPDGAARHVLAARPEVVVGPGQLETRVQAWSVGSGIGVDDESGLAQVRRVLDAAVGAVPVVVDAGGLAVLPERVPATVVLTPHAGELARLLGSRGLATTREDVESDPVAALRSAVACTGATVLLKGATTLVAGPGTPVYSQDDATPWLATAGAGDVLAGVVGAALAGRSAEVLAAPALAARLAAAAALVHGRAARAASGGGPIVALDVAAAIPAVVRSLLAGSDPWVG